MFLCPVVYPLSAVPEQFRVVLLANPLTATIETIRYLALWNEPPAWKALALWSVVTAGMAWMSFVWFMKTKKGFADEVPQVGVERNFVCVIEASIQVLNTVGYHRW